MSLLDGEMREGRHSMPVRVYYEDTDFTGIVYHASYLRFMERGRTNYLRLIGADHRALFEATEKEAPGFAFVVRAMRIDRSEEHTSELQSQSNLVCRLLLEKKKQRHIDSDNMQ